jgi:5-hydroxyisourate hydrolase
MSGYLTTHVLDTANGRPAAGVGIQLFRLEDGRRERLSLAVTNAGGRTDEPLVERGELEEGEYELVFDAGGYFGSEAFLGLVPVRFRVSDAGAHYHVPLLVSPWSYTTYRGS